MEESRRRGSRRRGERQAGGGGGSSTPPHTHLHMKRVSLTALRHDAEAELRSRMQKAY